MEKVIYVCWTELNEMPLVRRKCLDSLVNNSGCEIVVVTPANLDEFVLTDAPLHEAYQHLSATHKSDYLRCYFMHNYGGGYADIKQFDFDWSPWFEKIDEPNIWAVGYEEVGKHGVAQGAKNREILLQDYKKLIGTNAYIFNRRTKLTYSWHEALVQVLDRSLPILKVHPARIPDDQKGAPSSKKMLRALKLDRSKYPITWTGILGDIFHPLVYEYTENIDKSLPQPNWHVKYK